MQISSQTEYLSLIEQRLYELTIEIENLCTTLNALTITQSETYSIEEADLNVTAKSIKFDGSETIPVKKLDDTFLAFTKAKQTYKDFYNHRGTSSKIAFRVPGLIHIDPLDNHPEFITSLIEQITIVNALKQRLALLLRATPAEELFDRDDFFIKHFPYLVKLQVTRSIRFFQVTQLKSIDFHWSNKWNSDKTNKKDVLDKIKRITKRLRSSSDLSLTKQAQIKALEQTAMQVSNLGDNIELRYRRRVPPQPSLNLRFKKEKPINIPCAMPVIIFGNKPVVTGLDSFKPKKLTQPKGYSVIDEAINLYRKDK